MGWDFLYKHWNIIGILINQNTGEEIYLTMLVMWHVIILELLLGGEEGQRHGSSPNDVG